LANPQVPLSQWPKDPKLRDMGRFSRYTLEQDIEGYILYVAHLQGWSRDEVTIYAARLRRELRNLNIHGFFRVRVVWGRKP
jgi:hypothetical protein